MRLPDFRLERYFARWEFNAPYILCSSDVEGMSLAELLELADEQSLDLWQRLTLGYTETPGHPLLRAEIARMYERVSAEQVYTFAGAGEAIFVTLSALLGPGDHVIVTWPAYQSLYEVARAAGAEVDLLPLHERDGWIPDVDRLRALLRPSTRLIITNFPHNPTGALPSRAAFDRIVELAREAGVWLFSDEVYRELEHDPAHRLPAAVDRYERAVSLGVMSKSYGLAGLRLGWIATRDAEVLDRAARLKDYITICTSAPSEILALIALRARDRVVRRSLDIVRPNIALLDRFFEEWKGTFSWVRPRAGSIGFPRLDADISIDRFAADLVEQEGVLLLPGSAYAYDGNHFRIGFARRNMPEAVERLDRFARRALG
ncbi:MAG: aminotransferase class I/II-fold pyridoxal phosphate-dependent enzyme [Gemmatimonadaceae bacterium]